MTYGDDVNGYRPFDPIPGYQRAVVKTTQRTGKAMRRPDLPARYTIHVTVGRRLFDYPYPPQFTIGWGGGNSLPVGKYNLADRYTAITGPTIINLAERQVLRLQHCGAERSGYALRGSTLGETNGAGLANIQCEFILPVFNDPRALADWEYEIIATTIAEQIQAVRDFHNDQTLIDTTKIRDWKGSAAYGFNDPYEMTVAEAYAYDGIMGHVDWFDQSHWDPGNWDHVLLSKLVTEKLAKEELMNGVRIAGSDRYETAALFAQAHFGKAAKVLIVTGENFPDGLAAGSAGQPVLMVKQNEIPAATRTAIAALEPTSYTILGGQASVSKAVALELDALIHP